MNLTKRLKLKPASKKYTDQPEPHPLRAFFRAREITQVALCDLFNSQESPKARLHQSQLSLWLSGLQAIPLAIERRLKAVAEQILKEEGE